jgi:hypothetical protein
VSWAGVVSSSDLDFGSWSTKPRGPGVACNGAPFLYGAKRCGIGSPDTQPDAPGTNLRDALFVGF